MSVMGVWGECGVSVLWKSCELHNYVVPNILSMNVV